MKPPISILDGRFVYRDSVHTSIAATFERVRAEQKAADALREKTKAAEKPDMTNVYANFAQRQKGVKP